MSDERKAMVFGSGKGGGSDAWFWAGAIDGANPDEDDVFPLILQMGVWRKELTVEQARYLRDLRGARWWNHLDLRVVRQYLAEQEGKAPPAEPAPRAKQSKHALAARQADELIASLRQATAALLEAEKRYSPDQPRVPAGQEGGGQWTDGAGGEQVLTLQQRGERDAGEAVGGVAEEVAAGKESVHWGFNRVERIMKEGWISKARFRG
jgi:hypothetical protein